jgi:serine/threonine protein kinase
VEGRRALGGRYELGSALGSGGSATVYRARDLDLDRDVAVKVIPAALARHAGAGAGEGAAALLEDDAQFDRFRHEALALSRLRSRHVARVYDFGRDPAVGLYLVMELIEGVPLDTRSLGRALLPHEVLRVARALLAGLAEAHAHGIVHRDIKPSNLVVPRGGRGLDETRILDFGIAYDERRAQLLAVHGRTDDAPGSVLGTAAYMAPEQLRDGTTTAAADVYAAGIVLFDLLGLGLLFPSEPSTAQLAARLQASPSFEGRVPPPLGTLLSRMLERDPRKRFGSAGAALEAIGDLETAPVSIPMFDAGDPPTLAAADATAPNRPVRLSSVPPLPPQAPQGTQPSESLFRAAPSDLPPGPSTPPRHGLPLAFGARRLSRLARDPFVALRESIHALDLPMIDALARRERGSALSRIARAVVLALRLELDAAALILEPLTGQSELARALGSTLIAPRARRVTRTRVDVDKVDAWVAEVDLELGGLLCAMATSMTVREDAARNGERCKRWLERASPGAASSTLTTVRIAQLTAATFSGVLNSSEALADVIRLRDADRETASPFVVLVRAMLLGLLSFRIDEHVARDQLERATRLAAESGATLLEMRGLVAWGGMLVEIPERVEQGLGVLERATTLLAHGDAPSLEHVAEHNRGAALVIQGRYAEAAPHLRRARRAARGELWLEHEVLSCMSEGLSYVALGDRESAAKIVEDLTEPRLAQCSARTAAYCHIVRSIYAMMYEGLDRAGTELKRAYVRAAEAQDQGADAYLLAEALGILHAVARHEEVDILGRAGELQKLAQDRGLVSFYWFQALRAVVTHLGDEELKRTFGETLEKLIVLLGPMQLARA